MKKVENQEQNYYINLFNTVVEERGIVFDKDDREIEILANLLKYNAEAMYKDMRNAGKDVSKIDDAIIQYYSEMIKSDPMLERIAECLTDHFPEFEQKDLTNNARPIKRFIERKRGYTSLDDMSENECIGYILEYINREI